MRRLAATASVPLLALLALAPGLASGQALLPHVGRVIAVDVTARKLTLRGPDGVERTVTLDADGPLLREGGGDVSLAELAAEGTLVGVTLINPELAQVVVRLTGLERETERGLLSKVDRENRLIGLVAADGLSVDLRPAVNLGARDEADPEPGPAGWEWFEKRQDRPVRIRLVKMMGLRYIWSVEPWDPKRGDEPEAPGEAPAAAAAGTAP